MSWGTLQLGGLIFRETTTAAESNGTLTVTGQESTPPQSSAEVRAAYLNVLGLVGATVPLVASDKAELTGFYAVTAASVDDLNVHNGQLLRANWSAQLVRVGTERDVEFESRLTLVARSTDLAGPPAAVFWHAPPPGATSYYTGATVPAGEVVRQSADGAVPVYTGVPASIFPRWTVPAADYMAGAARVLLDGLRRAGLDTAGSSSWEVSNGLVQVTGGADATFTVAAWSGSAWVSAKGYVPTVNGTALTGVPELTIIRNDPEQVIARLSWPVTGAGRVSADLSLRRGARAVAGVLKRQAAATLGITRTAAEAATAVTGGVKATAADGDGNRFVLGSSKSTTTTVDTASIAKASTLSLDFFVGHEVGASPVAGDAFADLLSQHLGTVGDQTVAVRR